MLHLSGVGGGGAGPQSSAFSPASEPEQKEEKEMRCCLSYLPRSTPIIIRKNVSFTQKIRDVSLQSIKGRTCSHNSKANTKYRERGAVLKAQFLFFSFMNSIMLGVKVMVVFALLKKTLMLLGKTEGRRRRG